MFCPRTKIIPENSSNVSSKKTVVLRQGNFDSCQYTVRKIKTYFQVFCGADCMAKFVEHCLNQ